MIPETLVSFFESGVSILVGSTSEALLPSCSRAVGAHCSKDRAFVTVLLPEGPAKTLLHDLEQSRRAAIVFCRPADHRTLQIKGAVSEIRAAEPEEVERAIAYRHAYAETLAALGLPKPLTERLRISPTIAVKIRVEDLFRQTPGPDAGARLGPGIER